MLIVQHRDLADGEIEFGSEFPPDTAGLARTAARVARLQGDARTLDAVLADPRDFSDEWIAVFDGEVFRAGNIEELLTQFAAHGVNPGRAVKLYVASQAATGV